MMPASVRLLIQTAAILLVPALAWAQGGEAAQPEASRWWAGGGGGYLASRTACTLCDSDPPHRDGAAVLFQGGVRVSERLLVGAEVFSTARTSAGTDARNTYLLGVAQYRPFASHGFFLKGGYGLALVKVAVPTEGGQVAARTWGMGLMYGAGWVFREGRRLSIAPVGATYVTTAGDVRTPEGTAENVVANGWFAGIVVMFH
jgi:hypothetical protein